MKDTMKISYSLFREWNALELPQKIIQYHPEGKRRKDRPLKRLTDEIQLEAETGSKV
jgi:hypothetical protein